MIVLSVLWGPDFLSHLDEESQDSEQSENEEEMNEESKNMHAFFIHFVICLLKRKFILHSIQE